MELETLGVGLGGTSLLTIAVTWGVIKSRVQTLWEMRDKITVACTRVDTMWECMVEPAIKQGFVVRGMSLHLTDKGRSFLSPEIRQEIESLLKRDDVINDTDPCVQVLNHMSDKLRNFAGEKNTEVGVAFGTAQAYIEEVLRATPKPAPKRRKRRWL
jgi:hypothetical protein